MSDFNHNSTYATNTAFCTHSWEAHSLIHHRRSPLVSVRFWRTEIIKSMHWNKSQSSELQDVTRMQKTPTSCGGTWSRQNVLSEPYLKDGGRGTEVLREQRSPA